MFPAYTRLCLRTIYFPPNWDIGFSCPLLSPLTPQCKQSSLILFAHFFLIVWIVSQCNWTSPQPHKPTSPREFKPIYLLSSRKDSLWRLWDCEDEHPASALLLNDMDRLAETTPALPCGLAFEMCARSTSTCSRSIHYNLRFLKYDIKMRHLLAQKTF